MCTTSSLEISKPAKKNTGKTLDQIFRYRIWSFFHKILTYRKPEYLWGNSAALSWPKEVNKPNIKNKNQAETTGPNFFTVLNILPQKYKVLPQWFLIWIVHRRLHQVHQTRDSWSKLVQCSMFFRNKDENVKKHTI
jgi:hypothetical protein